MIHVGFAALGGHGELHRLHPERFQLDFLAQPLMLRDWLKRAWSGGVQGQAALAAMFNVSEAAMAVRLQQVGLVEPRTRPARLRGLIRPVRGYFRKAPVKQPVTCVPHPVAA